MIIGRIGPPMAAHVTGGWTLARTAATDSDGDTLGPPTKARRRRRRWRIGEEEGGEIALCLCYYSGFCDFHMSENLHIESPSHDVPCRIQMLLNWRHSAFYSHLGAVRRGKPVEAEPFAADWSEEQCGGGGASFALAGASRVAIQLQKRRPKFHQKSQSKLTLNKCEKKGP